LAFFITGAAAEGTGRAIAHKTTDDARKALPDFTSDGEHGAVLRAVLAADRAARAVVPLDEDLGIAGALLDRGDLLLEGELARLVVVDDRHRRPRDLAQDGDVRGDAVGELELEVEDLVLLELLVLNNGD